MNDGTNPRNNLNTILLTVVLGVLSFIGWGTLSNMVKLASIESAQVSRAEIAAKDATVQLQITELNKDIQDQRLQLTKLQIIVARIVKETVQ